MGYTIKGNMTKNGEAELQQYLDELESQKNYLEAMFSRAELIGDANEMLNIFHKMINFGMIEHDDYRLVQKNVYKTNPDGTKTKVKEKYKGFDTATIPNKAIYDPKKGGYIGQWPFAGLTRESGLLAKTYVHWGIRAEKGFEAPTVFSDNVWPIRIALVDNLANAERAAGGIVEVVAHNSNGKKATVTYKDDLVNFLRSGYQRVYTIKCNKWATFDQDIGYILVYSDKNTDTLVAKAYINWRIVIRKFMSLKEFCGALKNVMQEMFGGFNVEIDSTGWKDALEKQAVVIKRNNAFADKHDGDGAINMPM